MSEELREMADVLERLGSVYPERIRLHEEFGEADALSSLVYARDRVAICVQELRQRVNDYASRLGQPTLPEPTRGKVRYFGGAFEG
jgi:hypothetical protein